MSTKYRRADARLIYYVLEGASSLFIHLMLTLYAVYYTQIVGLNPFGIMILATVFEATIFLFEIPTGIVADLRSRRLSIILGVLLMGVGLLIEGMFPIFGAILAAQVIGGIGATFTSGATEAWITDEIGVERATKVFLRAAQLRTIMGIAGMGVSVLLGSIHLRLPVLVAGAALVGLAVFLVLFMPETGFKRAGEPTTWKAMVTTFRRGVHLTRLRPVLGIILVIAFLFGAHSEGFDNLWQRHFLDHFTLPPLGSFDPIVWFGVIGIGANLSTLLLVEAVRRLGWATGAARALLLVYALISGGIILFSLAGSFPVAVGLYWGVVGLRGVAKPISDAWLNEHLDPSIRATMFSMSSQIASVGEIVAGSPSGLLATVLSVRVALLVSGALLLFTLPLLRRNRERVVAV